ncbi:unnamed protein product [Callosobruchus maculatus]|uniref:Uncharacterized protein n=1 Tax=Callosobruchus maculatus TaxID=64391 RepID=A0A653C4C8_CALMS|nr:unnamed protein product [Callosobruchus maculatus]
MFQNALRFVAQFELHRRNMFLNLLYAGYSAGVDTLRRRQHKWMTSSGAV